jgi:hypothetical protein
MPEYGSTRAYRRGQAVLDIPPSAHCTPLHLSTQITHYERERPHHGIAPSGTSAGAGPHRIVTERGLTIRLVVCPARCSNMPDLSRLGVRGIAPRGGRSVRAAHFGASQ